MGGGIFEDEKFLSAIDENGSSQAIGDARRFELVRKFIQRFPEVAAGTLVASTASRTETEEVPDPWTSLTRREREICRHVVDGLTTNDIALRLAISPRTVETHRAKIMRKTGARNIAMLVRASFHSA